MAPSSLTFSTAKDRIFSAVDIPISIKRSGYRLFCHELGRQDPETGRAPTVRKALENTLAWMESQARREIEAFKPNPIQRRILHLIAVEGFTQDQAAIEINRSKETVKRYCVSLKRQLGADSLYQVVAIAVERGWIQTPRIP